jgi:hypothetical protein
MKISTHLHLVYGVEVKNSGICTFTPPYNVMHDYREEFNLDIIVIFPRVVYIRNVTEIFL